MVYMCVQVTLRLEPRDHRTGTKSQPHWAWWYMLQVVPLQLIQCLSVARLCGVFVPT